MKRCCRCKIEKDLNEFNKDKSRKDGLMYKCKLCEKEYRQLNREKKKQYYQMNKEKKKQYYLMNKEKIDQCQKQYYQMNKEKKKQYKKRSPEKHKARGILNMAVRRGKVHKPLYCSSCDSDKHLEAHHTDYSNPLEVLWLCRSCHRELHNKMREQSRI